MKNSYSENSRTKLRNLPAYSPNCTKNLILFSVRIKAAWFSSTPILIMSWGFKKGHVVHTGKLQITLSMHISPLANGPSTWTCLISISTFHSLSPSLPFSFSPFPLFLLSLSIICIIPSISLLLSSFNPYLRYSIDANKC